MATGRQHTPAAGRTTLLIAAVALTVLIGVALLVDHNNALTRWDTRVVASAARWRGDWISAAAETLTWLGSVVVLVPLVVIAWVAASLRGGGRYRPWLPALSLLFARVLTDLTKSLVDRARPPVDLALVVEHSAAYPSGHTTQSAATLLAIGLLASGLLPGRWRWLALAVCGTVLVGATRVVLGVHSPSDVVGGWALGTLCAVTAAWIARRPGADDSTPAPAADSRAGAP